jgi:hypothetical protein
MKEKATYQEDFEGVYLMHMTFPSEHSPIALKALEENTKTIQKVASRLFTTNFVLFNKIGMDRDDINSILTSYAYAYFTKYSNESEHMAGFLNRFLRQRSLRLIDICERKAEGIAEENTSLEIEELVTSAAVHNDNPENLLIAKETVDELMSIIDGTLTDQAEIYATRLHLKGKLGKIPKSYAVVMATNMAFNYAAKAIRNEESINAAQFQPYLASKFSKTLGKIR